VTFFRPVLALLAVTVLMTLGPQSGPMPHGRPRITQTTLANGLRIAVVENHDAPVAQVAMWYRVGSARDPRGRAGLAHALEHMMFRGTHELSGAGGIDLAARLGIETNAETNYDYTHYYQNVPADRVEAALRIDADRMRGLTLRASDWDAERKAVLAELAERRGNTVGMLTVAIRNRVYAGTPYMDDIGGGDDGVLRTSIDDLRRMYDAAYAPDNAVLVVTGDVDAPRIVSLARSVFGPIAARSHLAPSVPERPVQRGVTVRIASRESTALVDVVLEAHGMLGDLNGAEGVAAQVIDSSYAALRIPLVDHGPCDSYDVWDDTQLRGGLYHIVCRLSAGENPDNVAKVVRKTLLAMADHSPRESIRHARDAFIANTAFSRDDVATEADLYGATIALTGYTPHELDAKTAQLRGDVRRVLRRWSTPIAVGIATPDRSVRSSLAQGAPDSTISIGPRTPARDSTATSGKRRTYVEQPVANRAGEVVLPEWARAELSRPVLARAAPPPERFTLANGLRVVIRPRTTNGTVYVRAGFDDDQPFGPPGSFGAGRIAQHLYTAGTRRWPRKRIAEVQEKRDMTVDLDVETNMHGFVGDLPTMLDIVSDAWRSPRMDEKSVSVASFQTLQESAQVRRYPDVAALVLFYRQLTGSNVGGDVRLRDVLHGGTVAKVRALFNEHVRPERTWIAVTGDVDPADVRARIQAAFATWHAAPAPRPLPARHVGESRGFQAVVRAVRTTERVLLGQSAPRQRDADFPAMLLLNAALGSNAEFDTRLMQEMRVRRGLVYGVFSWYTPQPDGTLIVMFDCDPRDTATARNVVRNVIKEMRTRPPSGAELERVRRKVIATTFREEVSLDGILDRLAAAARDTRAPETSNDLARRLEAVTAADVARVARNVLRPDRLIEVDEGPAR
jgi:zinc protease